MNRVNNNNNNNDNNGWFSDRVMCYVACFFNVGILKEMKWKNQICPSIFVVVAKGRKIEKETNIIICQNSSDEICRKMFPPTCMQLGRGNLHSLSHTQKNGV